MHRIGIDLGGTKTELIVTGDNPLEVIQKKRVETERAGYSGLLGQLKGLVDSVRTLAVKSPAVGLGAPGFVDPYNGSVGSSNLTPLRFRPFQQDLQEQLQMPVRVVNDANCFALAEATIGAAKKYNVVFGVILGTGCGGGISIHKNIHRGANRIAGEWGHHTLYPDGRDCYCGNKGCTESYISGTALEKEWQEISGTFSRVTDVIDNKLYESHPEWRSNFILNFGRAMANVIDILDPDAIVIGGGLSKIDFLYTDGKESAYSETFSEIVSTPILKNKLGDSGGVFGAAMLADHI